MPASRFFLGLDVGTGSARAGIFDNAGAQIAAASRPIQLWKPAPDFAEQSSDDIWRACGEATREALRLAGLPGGDIRGIGFDATCSLVVLDASGRPVSASPGGRDEQNVIVWMDHRAVTQATRINETHHSVLRYVGGKISPEMETPKLLWLKENLPSAWQRAAHFFDLPDFLTWRATGDATRSLCSTVCKWTYLGHEPARAAAGAIGRWDDSYFRQIGLGDLVDENYARIGSRVRPMGEPLGRGLTPQAAAELGLPPGTPVGVSIIDAHAGGLGVLGATTPGETLTATAMEERLALIGGTSSCHMAVSREPRFIPGIWGPYHSAMIPGLWLTEGGQSATGALIDHIIFSHARAAELQEEAKARGQTVYERLNARLAALAAGERFPARLTRELHVLPYFHGNRSPRADPTLLGGISGLPLSGTPDDLARLYLATIQAIACGTRHIIGEMNAAGYRIRRIFACGGGTKNPVFLREHADITGCAVYLPKEPEAVLLGAAVLGAVAAGHYPSVLAAMAAMNRTAHSIAPARGETAAYHDAKYQVFQRQYADQLGYRKLMESAETGGAQ